MEDNNPVIEDVAGGVLFDDTHNPAHKLNERRQIGEDVKHRRNREEGVVEAFAELADLA